MQVPELFYLPEVLLSDSEMVPEDSQGDKLLGISNFFLIVLTQFVCDPDLQCIRYKSSRYA